MSDESSPPRPAQLGGGEASTYGVRGPGGVACHSALVQSPEMRTFPQGRGGDSSPITHHTSLRCGVRLGAMNHPMREVVDEIRTFHRLGFNFVDLTLEPERARADMVDLAAVARVLADCGMGVVGHTAWYLPIASPFASLRQAARDEMIRCFDAFARLGIDRVNV